MWTRERERERGGEKEEREIRSEKMSVLSKFWREKILYTPLNFDY